MTAAQKTPDSAGNKEVVTSKFTGFNVNPSDLTVVGIDTDDDESHPLYDPRIKLPLSENMVLNIMHMGVLEPIQVVKDGIEYRVVDGRRRTLHARVANERLKERGLDPIKVPIVVKKGDNKMLFAMGQASNRFRVNSGPMESAKAAARFVALGGTVEEIANNWDCSEQHVRDMLKLLELDPKVQETMLTGELTATAALMLAPLPKQEQVAALADLKAESAETGKKPTVNQAKRVVQQRGGQPGNRSSTALTPKERVDKAVMILTKFSMISEKERTKDLYAETLQKVSRALAGKTLEKLASDEEDEKE